MAKIILLISLSCLTSGSILLFIKSYTFLNILFNNWFLITISVLFSLSFLFIITLSKKTKNNLIKNYSEIELKEEQFNMFLLFYGITILLVEFILNIFIKRNKYELIFILFFAVLLLFTYVIKTKTKFFVDNYKILFTIFYLIFFAYSILIVTSNPLDIFSYISLIINLFFSYYIFKNILYYLNFTVFSLLLIIILFFQKIIDTNLFLLIPISVPLETTHPPLVKSFSIIGSKS